MNLGWFSAAVERVVSVLCAEQVLTSSTASLKTVVKCDLLYVQWSVIGVVVGNLMQSIKFSGYVWRINLFAIIWEMKAEP